MEVHGDAYGQVAMWRCMEMHMGGSYVEVHDELSKAQLSSRACIESQVLPRTISVKEGNTPASRSSACIWTTGVLSVRERDAVAQ